MYGVAEIYQLLIVSTLYFYYDFTWEIDYFYYFDYFCYLNYFYNLYSFSYLYDFKIVFPVLIFVGGDLFPKCSAQLITLCKFKIHV